jgi:16S rRNA (cytosine1402-N4)-methyltransferase
MNLPSDPIPLYHHISVLASEVITGLQLRPGGNYLDTTFGGGGHSRLLLESLPDLQVTAIDRDEQALAAAQPLLDEYGSRLTLWQGNFADYAPKNGQFDGIIADLGVSSPQLDQPARGFSFRVTSPLDMRMDQNQNLSAAEIINHWDSNQLANLFYEYGEERLSRQIARQIVKLRPFETTTDLAGAIAGAVPPSYRYGRIHPATRVFQALRIAVNGELTALEQLLEKSPYWLKTGGIIAIISFHSLEDRRVKHFFRNSPLLQVLTKKPIIPSLEEQRQNPRSRSAKLRLAQRLECS